MLRATRKLTVAFLLGVGLFLSVQLRVAFAQAPADLLWKTEGDWQRAYEQSRQSDPAFKVESLDEFKRITSYYKELESDGVTQHSFHTASGDAIRCIDVARQRSFLQSAPSGATPPLGPSRQPQEIGSEAKTATGSRTEIGKLFGLDASRDEDGNSRSCPALTFPKLIPKLNSLYHFQRLEQIFQKYPDGHRGVPPHAANAKPADLGTANGANAR